METSTRAGLPLVREFEGCELEAYKCPAGIWTIGYGITGGIKPGQKITKEQAEVALIQTYDRFERRVRPLVKVDLTANQLGALVSFAYNLGAGALASSTLLKRVNEGKFTEAAAQFARWNKAGGKVLAGLTRRREAEAKLFAA